MGQIIDNGSGGGGLVDDPRNLWARNRAQQMWQQAGADVNVTWHSFLPRAYAEYDARFGNNNNTGGGSVNVIPTGPTGPSFEGATLYNGGPMFNPKQAVELIRSGNQDATAALLESPSAPLFDLFSGVMMANAADAHCECHSDCTDMDDSSDKRVPYHNVPFKSGSQDFAQDADLVNGLIEDCLSGLASAGDGYVRIFDAESDSAKFRDILITHISVRPRCTITVGGASPTFDVAALERAVEDGVLESIALTFKQAKNAKDSIIGAMPCISYKTTIPGSDRGWVRLVRPKGKGRGVKFEAHEHGLIEKIANARTGETATVVPAPSALKAHLSLNFNAKFENLSK